MRPGFVRVTTALTHHPPRGPTQGNAVARAELVITEPRQGSTAARMLGMRLMSGGGSGSGRGTGADASTNTSEFGDNSVVRVHQWHLISLSCRRSSLFSLGSSMFSGQAAARRPRARARRAAFLADVFAYPQRCYAFSLTSSACYLSLQTVTLNLRGFLKGVSTRQPTRSLPPAASSHPTLHPLRAWRVTKPSSALTEAAQPGRSTSATPPSPLSTPPPATPH